VISLAKKKRGRTSSTRKSSKKTKRVTKKQPKKNIYPIIGIIAIVVIIIVAKYSGIEAETKGKVVGVVNGELIYEEELQREITKIAPFIPPNQDIEQVQKAVLFGLINNKLLLIEAENNNIEVSEEQIDEEISRLTIQLGISFDELNERLTSLGITFEEYKDEVRTQIKITRLLNSTVFSELTVSDEEVTEYQEANPNVFKSIRSRHILISTDNRTDEEALAIMNEVKAAFDEDNSKFCELVTEYSDDIGSIETCGEYPPENLRNFIKEYQETAIKNKVGESNVVKSMFGYHLIETLEKTPFSSEEIRTVLLTEKRNEAFRKYIEELRSNAEIINCFETPEVSVCLEEEETEEETTEEPVEEDSIVTFAKCLNEKGAKMFGAYWCSHCAAQKRMFGDAWEHITYVECSIEGNQRAQTEICQNERISGYPTWEINGQKHTGEQTLDNLAKLSGCVLT